LSRLAKSLGALAAIVALAGLSTLPLEHVHERTDDDTGGHSVVVHRHYAAHKGSSALASRLLGHGLGAVDDDHAETIRVVFTTRPRAEARGGAWLALAPAAGIDLQPLLADGESFVPPRRLYTSPPDIAPALRGPPASS